MFAHYSTTDAPSHQLHWLRWYCNTQI